MHLSKTPFYAIPRITPPLWYNRIILESMLEVYESWHEKLSELDDEFYLKIWLFDPHFIDSQIVAAYKESLNYYDRTFEGSNDEKQFPYHKFAYLRDKLKLFDWRLHIDSDVYTDSDLLDNVQRGWMSEKEFESIKKKAHITEIINLPGGTTDTVYSVKVGDVWIGSLKNKRSLKLASGKL